MGTTQRLLLATLLPNLVFFVLFVLTDSPRQVEARSDLGSLVQIVPNDD